MTTLHLIHTEVDIDSNSQISAMTSHDAPTPAPAPSATSTIVSDERSTLLAFLEDVIHEAGGEGTHSSNENPPTVLTRMSSTKNRSESMEQFVPFLYEVRHYSLHTSHNFTRHLSQLHPKPVTT
jgi:hypothetical protein